jgi:hypothetical protein
MVTFSIIVLRWDVDRPNRLILISYAGLAILTNFLIVEIVHYLGLFLDIDARLALIQRAALLAFLCNIY